MKLYQDTMAANRNQSNPPPNKISRPANKMNVDTRDSLSEFQSSIFDASDGHQLVDFIRKKKGLRSQQQKIFDDVPTNRQSLHIEIQRLDEYEKSTTVPEKNNPAPVEESEKNPTNGVSASPSKDSINSPRHSKTLFKRLSQCIGRRTLLKEFEKTLQESRFLPATCSTPLTGELTSNQTNAMKEKSGSVNQGHLNIVCTPITVTDEESPLQSNRANESNKTAEMAKDLQQQVDIVLERNSNENLLVREECEESEDENQSNKLPMTSNRISSPAKAKHRQTYTIERDSDTNNFILSPSKSVATSSSHYRLLKTPEKIVKANTSKKLIVTPKQKQLLLSKFGRHPQVIPSPRKASSPQRSRIPVPMHANTGHVAPEVDAYVESMNISQQHPETDKLIEQLQKNNTSNVPVIVIPVNQTFNQIPPSTEPVAASKAIITDSPRPHVTTPAPSPAKIPRPPPSVSSNNSSRRSTPVKMDRLRFKDIITDDESSDCSRRVSQNRKILRRRAKRALNNSRQCFSSRPLNQYENKLSLTFKQNQNSSHHVREVIKRDHLSRMSEYEILDLRKRNSSGELRRSMQLSQRESSLLDKQMELELLRRNIQENNYEDEVLQVEVMPPPPDEFCDRSRRRLQDDVSLRLNDDFVDENSGDRVSLNPRSRLSKSSESQKITRKKKKVPEQVKNYLQTSQKLKSSKYLNLSKRKLYNKGESEERTSMDSTTPTQTKKRRSKQRKSNKAPFSPPQPEPMKPASPKDTSPMLPQPPDKSTSPRTEHVNTSKESVQFLPQDEVSQKPVEKLTKKKRTYKKRKPKISLGPVDPDMGTSFISINNQDNACRRSKREKKLPTAYWSCTQKDFKPLYDYNEVANKGNYKWKKKNPSVNKDLVVNTKETQINSVGELKKNKNSTVQPSKSKRTKQAKKHEGDDNGIPVTELNAQKNNYHADKQLSQQESSKANKQSKEKNSESESISAEFLTHRHNNSSRLVDDPSPNRTLEANVHDTIGSKIISDSDKTLTGNAATISNKETNRFLQNFRREPIVKLTPLSKSNLSASLQGSSGYSSDVSSVQQIRLATIVEDSVPNVNQHNVNSTIPSETDKRLSRELMPPPSTTKCIRSKTSASKVQNSKKSAFRTEHDESIADVSSDHINKLFDQLKSSSVCIPSDVASNENESNCSGQVSLHSQPTESNSIRERKFKKLAVRLPRMRVKDKPSHSSEKVCDSGFSSEDMPSVPKQKGDVLLNWLKQIIVNNKSSSSTADKGVARFLQADGFHASAVEDLIFQEVDGVEYAFYDTKQPFSIGYIRFNPQTGKKKATAKKFELNFVVLSGNVNIIVNNSKFDCKNGDLITVFTGTSYVIKNISNDPALVMVIKK